MDGEGLITHLIKVAEDVSRGDFGSYDEIFELTKTGKYPEPIARLAEAFGMMIVKVEARELKLEQTIEFLQKAQAELAEAHNALKKRHSQLKKTLKERLPFSNIIGVDKNFKELIKQAELLSKTDINVLITGETGTGKEVFAKFIHFNSDRREGPFVAINCSAIPESLFESEVFGIEKGTATGVYQRIGKMEQANGGTLFLDEIGDMPLSCQAKILRAIEDLKIERIGGREEIALDIRVICATNKDLKDECEKGHFRQDLFYRLNVGRLKIPPLRERRGNIILLANYFVDNYSKKIWEKED